MDVVHKRILQAKVEKEKVEKAKKRTVKNEKKKEENNVIHEFEHKEIKQERLSER